MKHIYLEDREKIIDKILGNTFIRLIDGKYIILFPDDRLTISPEKLIYHKSISRQREFLYYIVSSSVELVIRNYSNSYKKVNKEEMYNKIKDSIKMNVYMDFINGDFYEAKRNGVDV